MQNSQIGFFSKNFDLDHSVFMSLTEIKVFARNIAEDFKRKGELNVLYSILDKQYSLINREEKTDLKEIEKFYKEFVVGFFS